MDLKSFLDSINLGFTLAVVFPSIVALGLYFTLKLNCVQITRLPLSFAALLKRKGSDKVNGNISRFGAISAVLAGNFGTGNISGMAVAMCTGGPGALIWMWIMAFFGAAIQYASSILGISYRQKMTNNEYVGGPMYYLRDGLGYKKLAILFATFTIFGAITVGLLAQINSVVLPLEKLGLNPFYSSLCIMCFVAFVTLGGIQRIASFASYIVPFKALLYLSTAFVILFFHYDKIPQAFGIMFTSAFDYTSVVGGALGMGVFHAIKTGFDRGLFATDAGTGIVPILQASSRSDNPVIDGIVTLVAPLMVMIVCTTTGLVLLVTGAWQQTGLESTNMVTYAFSQGLGSQVGGYIVVITLLLFAYTTILAWGYCGEKAFGFLVGADNNKKKLLLFRYFYILLVPVGSVLHVNLIWTLADIAITLMVVTNVIGIAKLRSKVIQISQNSFSTEVSSS